MIDFFGRKKEPVPETNPNPLSGEIGGKLVNGYERRAPSNQTAVDLVSGWTTRMPRSVGAVAGDLKLLSDQRVRWAINRCGDITNRRVLEIGPLEAAHTWLLETAGARVDAVESNGAAYIKCLIMKEILGLKLARFLLGDINGWLEATTKRYHLIVASGVLYHMVDPLKLLWLLAQRTNNLFLWTMYVDEDLPPTRVESFQGVDVRLYRVAYGERTQSFCGGPNSDAMWIHRQDLLAALDALGFSQVEIEHQSKSDYGKSASFFATRQKHKPLRKKPETAKARG